MPAGVIMPALGLAQETGKVLRGLQGEGGAVAKGEPLLEIETDKVTVEIEAPADGTLAGISAPEGAEVPVGTAIAHAAASGETVAGEAAPPRRRLASPKARRLAQERGIDLDALDGSGPNGAGVAADVGGGEANGGGFDVGTVWRVMAERTQRSWQEVPHFFLARDVDATRLNSWRDAA